MHNQRNIAQAREKMRTIRTGKGRIINQTKQLFDVEVVQLTETDIFLPPRDGTIIIGYVCLEDIKPWVAGCATGTKNIEIHDFFEFFTVVIYFP